MKRFKLNDIPPHLAGCDVFHAASRHVPPSPDPPKRSKRVAQTWRSAWVRANAPPRKEMSELKSGPFEQGHAGYAGLPSAAWLWSGPSRAGRGQERLL